MKKFLVLSSLFVAVASIVGAAVVLTRNANALDADAAIDAALFSRVPFFGAETRVPRPASEARERLAALRGNFPANERLVVEIARLDESLGDFANAESELAALPESRRRLLAEFYERRAEFAKAGAVRASIFQNAPPERRPDEFATLVAFAAKHELAEYLSTEFFAAAAAGEGDSTSILGKYLDKLVGDGDFDRALEVLDANAARFPEDALLGRRVAILEAAGRREDAVRAYAEGFRTNWTTERSAAFYEFMRGRERLDGYVETTKARFRRDPSDFDAAARLIDFARDRGDGFAAVVARLENARTKSGKGFSSDELLALADYLAGGDDAAASRMLYAIAADFRPAVKSDLRRAVLFRVFKLVANAGERRLPIVRGSADFLASVASTDVRPGMTTAVLALLFSDAGMNEEFEKGAGTTAAIFNRAAAFRIMRDFQNEFPGSPELASMYLEIVRLYATRDPKIAASALRDFEKEFDGFGEFADAAIKLADAYNALGDFMNERVVLAALLGRLGASDAPKFRDAEIADADSPPKDAPPTVGRDAVLYEDVLARLVGSLSRDGKTAEIIELYGAESEKYPAEARLASELLRWLDQTSMTERQALVYRGALQRFPGAEWTDRYARWLLRQRRDAEFEELSRSVVESFGREETRDYLANFIKNGVGETAEARLYLGLYSAAHARFPDEPEFATALLRYYAARKMDGEWRKLAAEYFFTSPSIRGELLDELARAGELRGRLADAEIALGVRAENERAPFRLFAAAASERLSAYERAAECYRELAASHPQIAEFSDAFARLSRSLGQTDRAALAEAADFAGRRAEQLPADEARLTAAGETAAELGDYDRARLFWDRIANLTAGENDGYLSTASVFWDYFRFDDALRTIAALREKRRRDDLFAFQSGAILESTNRREEALAEYLKAISGTAPAADERRAKVRLATLAARPEIATELDRAYRVALGGAPDKFRLTFNYADVFFRMKRTDVAVDLLRKHAATETDTGKLEETKQFYRDVGDAGAVQEILARIEKVAPRPQDAIAAAVERAADLREARRAGESAAVLGALLKRFPNRFGVIGEVERGLWDGGRRAESLAVLRAASARSNPEYRDLFDRRIAERLAENGDLAAAAEISRRLLSDDPGDSSLLGTVIDLDVRLRRPDDLRDRLREAIGALRAENPEPRQYAFRLADLHRRFLPAFEALGDNAAAAAEHIEIINADPTDEDATGAALDFAVRTGTTDKLIAYYRNLSATAFKNYRWNLVLARLYAARGEYAAATAEYRLALADAPDEPEVRRGLFEVLMTRREFSEALAVAETLIETAGQSDDNLQLKIRALESLGRTADAAAERLKLRTPPPEPRPARADVAPPPETAESYRGIVENLVNAPLDGILNGADIENFVSSTRPDDGLGVAAERLWTLRERLDAEAERAESADAGRARGRLKTLDDAFANAVCREIRTSATFAEIAVVRRQIESRMSSGAPDFARRFATSCGFDDLVENQLRANAANGESNSPAWRELVAFYVNRGDQAAVAEFLKPRFEALTPEFLRPAATAARLTGDAEFEENALRSLFFAPPEADSETSARYVEVLAERDRPELEKLVATPGAPHRLQTINVLLARRETALASAAIGSSSFPESWKKTRRAEIDGRAEAFREALGGTTIGELLANGTGDLRRDSWLVTAARLGRSDPAAHERFLAAEIERRPADADAQFDLGYFRLARHEPARALEHFRLAIALRPDDRSLRAYAGAALYGLGRRDEAFAEWEQIFDRAAPSAADAKKYVETLAGFGEFEAARTRALPVVEKLLKSKSDPASAAEFGEVLRALAATFSEKTDAAAFLADLCRRTPPEARLAALIADAGIAGDEFADEFLALAFAETPPPVAEDFDFTALPEAASDQRVAELKYDAANGFPPDKEADERTRRLQALIALGFDRQRPDEARKWIEVADREARGRRPRPVWLRLAALRLASRRGDAALAGLLRDFTGIAAPAENGSATLPSADRLALVAGMLRAERNFAAADELEADFYARRLAANQVTVEDLDQLARASFRLGDAATALDIADMMTAPDNENLATRIAAIPRVAKFAALAAVPEPVFSVDVRASLAAAARSTTDFGSFAESAEYRARLAEIAPEDVVNRLELARLRAHGGDADAGAEMLVAIIADTRGRRADRWRALTALAGFADSARLRAIATDARLAGDPEIVAALASFAAAADGDFRTAAAAAAQTDAGATSELLYLGAVFELKAGDFAVAARLAARVATRGESFSAPAVFPFGSPAALQAEAELAAGRPLLAFEIARRDGVFRLDALRPPDGFGTFDATLNAARSVAEARIAKTVAVAADAAGDSSLALRLAEKLSAAAPAAELAEATRFAGEMKKRAAEKPIANAPVLNDRDF